MIERFKAKCQPDPESGCWPWTGAVYPNGYGAFGVEGTVQRAHRVSYELFVGPIPEDMHIDHLCRNRLCQNPQHLEAVPKRTNTLRGEGPTASNARKTECSKGHQFDQANTYYCQQGKYVRRRCRQCDRDRHRKTYQGVKKK